MPILKAAFTALWALLFSALVRALAYASAQYRPVRVRRSARQYDRLREVVRQSASASGRGHTYDPLVNGVTTEFATLIQLQRTTVAAQLPIVEPRGGVATEGQREELDP